MQLHPSGSPLAGTSSAFHWLCPPTPACPAPRRPVGRDAGIAGTPGWGSRDLPVASQPFSESALSPALRGVLTAKAGLCRGTGSRGSALGTSLLPRPLWSRRVAGLGPTAAPRSTAWRSCCTALVGKDGPLREFPLGQRSGQESPQSWGLGIFSNLRSPSIPVLKLAREQS